MTSVRDNTLTLLEDTTIEDVLKTVEALYAQKDYEKALKTLESNKDSVSSGLWHYNMGTVHGKLGHWAMARFHFLKADLAGFRSTEASANAKLTESMLGTEKLEKPTSTSDYLIKVALFSSEGLLTTLSLCLLIAGLIGFWKKASIKVLASFLAMALVVTGASFWIRSWDRVIVIDKQSVYEGPSAIFASRDEVPEGVVLITSPQGEWREVIFPSRFQGWIKNIGLKELK